MVGPYPAAEGLRRRRARMEANGEVFPEANPPPQQHRRRRRRAPEPPPTQPRLSSLYFMLSALLALVAIVTSSSSRSSPPLVVPKDSDASSSSAEVLGQQDSYFIFNYLFAKEGEQQEEAATAPVNQPRTAPALFRWMMPPVRHHHHHHDDRDDTDNKGASVSTSNPVWNMAIRLVDPTLLHPQPSTPTDVIDKILTSTPRMLAIANLLLSMTYLLHSAVANLFLGQLPTQEARSWAGRERLGGFLVFKLLLISAVVAPDTLDLLILLFWYTLLSFLRSLAYLAAATTAHTSQSGQAPKRGVLNLLLAVLASNVLAAAVCVALFHAAGWGMVLLLTCDCAQLAVDVLGHILQHISQVMEEAHSYSIAELEERQIELSLDEQDDDEDDDVMEESRQLDRRMEFLEELHSKRTRVLDSTIFALQLSCHILTMIHFLHIWSLHGLQFTLIDGILFLQLHSTVSSLSKKIMEKRNLNRIARDLDGLFQDASVKNGDVCCICLVTLTTGNVKKVACGHLYHTHCLREVVERARSIEAAKCPLCRASVLDGRHYDVAASIGNNEQQDNVEERQGPPQGGGDGGAPPANPPPPGEHALFRFSTESILPAWLPLPAFSFEVVRRPPTAAEAPQPAAAAAENNNRPSFLQRLLVLAGAIPMSPEEEALALDQLVDMFPQYDRADLLRELRERGSSEAVVDAVLVGVFRGLPRGDNGQMQVVEFEEEEELQEIQ